LKKMKPLVSVITVSLNAAATIEDTVASVSCQLTPFGIEHICVDGGSTDATRSIIDRWAKVGWIPILAVYGPDNGIFDAMNKGLGAARGEYVLFLNADDFLVSDRTLATAMQGVVLGAKDNPDLIVGNVSMGVLGRRGIWRHRCVPTLLERLRGWGLFPLHQAQFTKRSLMDAMGGFDVQSRLAADTILYYDLEHESRPSMRVLPFDVAFMRAGGAANAGGWPMWNGTVEIYRHLIRRHSRARAIGMVLVKTLQSVSEIRYGRCLHTRWFSNAIKVHAS
jgi:glycosyltransferase involved in cell wall biosynthesis